MSDFNRSVEEEVPLLSSSGKTAKKRIITVEPVLTLYIIYFSGSIPLLQQYIYKRTGEKLYGSVNNTNFQSENISSACEDISESNSQATEFEQEVQRQSALWLVSFTAVYLLPSLVSSLMFGSYSDVVGRKISLVVAIVGACLKCIVVVIVIWLELPLPYLYIGWFIEGILGGAITFITASFSYMSDITTREQRALRIIILEFCLALGVLISEIVTGYFIDYLGFLWPIVVILGTLVIALIYTVIFLPEARPRTAQYKEAKFFKLGNFTKSFKIFILDTYAKRRWKLHFCLVLILLFGTAELGRTDVSTLYVLGSPLCFTPILIGYYAAVAHILPALGSVITTRLCQPWLRELGLIMLGCVSATAGCVMLAFVDQVYLVFLTCVVGFFGRLPVGMLRSYSSKVVEPDEIGALFASFAWLEAVSAIIGSLIFTTVYNTTLDWFRGFVYIVIAACYVIGFLLTLFLKLRERNLAKDAVPSKWRSGITSSVDFMKVDNR